MFDRFMRDYLTVKSKSQSHAEHLRCIREFQVVSASNVMSTPIAEIVADIYRYARHFIKFGLC